MQTLSSKHDTVTVEAHLNHPLFQNALKSMEDAGENYQHRPVSLSD